MLFRSNILDLCLFRSLQSLTDCRAPQSIRELIEGVEQEYENYEVDKLARSFVSLQSCIREVLRKGGGIDYKVPHMNKERRHAEGWLPIALSVDLELVEQTLALIAESAAPQVTCRQHHQQPPSSTLQAAATPSKHQQHPPSSSNITKAQRAKDDNCMKFFILKSLDHIHEI